MSDHAKTLEPKIRKIQDGLSKMAAEKHAERLFTAIHRPGWTTPQEAELVHAMVDSIAHQIEGLDRAYGALVAAADKIGQT